MKETAELKPEEENTIPENELDNYWLVITTAAVYEDLRTKYITQLSYPEKYIEDIFYQVGNLKHSNIFPHIKGKNEKLLEIPCFYLFTNLHKEKHEYEPIRVCTIKKINMPELISKSKEDTKKDEFDDNDFIDLSIELGHFIGLKDESLRSKFRTYLDDFIKEKEFHYQRKKRHECEKLKDKPKIKQCLEEHGVKSHNTYIFAVPKDKIKDFIDLETNRGNNRWRDIVTRMLKINKKSKTFFPGRSQEPVDFKDCFFYKWDIYDSSDDKLIEPKNGKYELSGGHGYEIKFETYVPDYDKWKYTTRKSKVIVSDEGPLNAISDKAIIFSVSQISQQQHFNFSTKRSVTKENTILQVKAHVEADSEKEIEKELVKQPEFRINIAVKRFIPLIVIKFGISFVSAVLLAVVAAQQKEILFLSPYAALFLIGTLLPLLSAIYELIFGKLPD